MSEHPDAAPNEPTAPELGGAEPAATAQKPKRVRKKPVAEVVEAAEVAGVQPSAEPVAESVVVAVAALPVLAEAAMPAADAPPVKRPRRSKAAAASPAVEGSADIAAPTAAAPTEPESAAEKPQRAAMEASQPSDLPKLEQKPSVVHEFIASDATENIATAETSEGVNGGAEDDADEAPAASEPPEPIVPIGIAQVVSGQFDADEADEAVSLKKRVLAPTAEAPKLHKVLAQAGMGSRLDMEAAIEAGEVQVNGQKAHVGQRVRFGDTVQFRGRSIRVRGETPRVRVIAYHKPVGEIVTYDDPQNRPTVFRRLPKLRFGKWLSVGRLDINTEGLLLFTNSGELANRLMHPRYGLVRRYAVRVLGALDEAQRQKLLDGIQLDDGLAQFSSVEPGGGEGANVWYEVTIAEGRNREVRRLFEAVGHAVSRLIRIQYGIAPLPRGLKRGMYLELGEAEVRTLGDTVGSAETSMESGERRGGRGQPGRGRDGGREGGREGGRQGGRQGGPGDGRGRPERGGMLRGPVGDAGQVELPPDAQFVGGPSEGPAAGGEGAVGGEGRRDRRDRFGRNRGRRGEGDGSNRPPREGGGQREGQGGQRDGQREGQRDAQAGAPRDAQGAGFRGNPPGGAYPQDGQRQQPERSRRDDPDYDPYEFQPPSGITHEARMSFGKRSNRAPQGGGAGAGPDPMRTSMGYIADGGFNKGNFGGGGGGGGGNRGGGGGNRGGGGGNRSGGGGGGGGGGRSRGRR